MVVDVVVGRSVTSTGTSSVVMEKGDGLGSEDGVGVTLVACSDGAVETLPRDEDREGDGEEDEERGITVEGVGVAESMGVVVGGCRVLEDVVDVGSGEVVGELAAGWEGLAGFSATTVSAGKHARLSNVQERGQRQLLSTETYNFAYLV